MVFLIQRHYVRHFCTTGAAPTGPKIYQGQLIVPDDVGEFEFASYISRAVVVVPGDLVSMIHGALRMPYRPYLLGSIMGVMPEMLVQTYIGAQLKHLTIKSVLVMIALIAATLAFSLILNKKVSRSGKQMDKEDF